MLYEFLGGDLVDGLPPTLNLEEALMRIQVEAISCQVLGAVAWNNGRSSLSRRLGRSSPHGAARAEAACVRRS